MMNAFDYFFEKTSDLDKIFLVGNESITFKDLYNTSLNLSSWIAEEFGHNHHIVLISVNNLFFIKIYLAILKSGNICIPLDPAIEKENFNFILELTNPVLVFSTNNLKRKLSNDQYKFITPEDSVFSEGRIISEKENKGFEEKECAEIIFTSGSQGKPKGVMISHSNIIANTGSILNYLELSETDRMLVVLPFYYCYGLSLLHTHLRTGGSIVLNNAFIFLGTVIKNLSDYECTGFAGVPSHFQILLRMSDSFKKHSFPDLKYVTQAGGKLAPVFIDEFRESFPEIKFYVMYGQTEATARLSYLPPDIYEKKKGSIGKAIPGVEIKVVNREGENVTAGETGEIIAKGKNVMMGYFRDNLCTQKVIRDGWLHTGDIGTIDEDGFIYLIARINEIIKVRGIRINPKEIEEIISRLPEVIDCHIVGVEDKIEGETLKASVYITKGSSGKLDANIIKQHCARYLALYKVPKIFEIKEDLKFSSTGKKII